MALQTNLQIRYVRKIIHVQKDNLALASLRVYGRTNGRVQWRNRNGRWRRSRACRAANMRARRVRRERPGRRRRG